LFDHIRRIPNPNFRSRFSNHPDEAPSYLFDRTDALIYAAQKWGGYEAYFQASLAAFNLGLLRDARFVLPLLSMRKFDDRLAGVACLAFIQTERAIEKLRAIAVQDSSSIVREAALWACGFIEGKRAEDLFSSQQECDPDPRLRDFCKVVQQFDYLDWWNYGGEDAIR
jgi:HEAT repeat protein